jgi:hypothetical protein
MKVNSTVQQDHQAVGALPDGCVLHLAYLKVLEAAPQTKRWLCPYPVPTPVLVAGKVD